MFRSISVVVFIPNKREESISMRNRKCIALLLTVCLLASACLTSAAAYSYYYDGYPEYIVQSYSPNGYCYLYDQASSVNGKNLGRYNNGEIVKVIDWYGGNGYAFVICANNDVGYINQNSLTDAASASYCSTYRVYSTNPKGYCYLYDQPSSVNGRNLGRYDNGEYIDIIDWYASDDYAKVCCQSTGKYGYIRKSCLVEEDNYPNYYRDDSMNYPDYSSGSSSSSGGYHISLDDVSGYDLYYVQSLDPYGYCYLYDKPSSVSGSNLGRYNNETAIYVVNWYADDNYALVLCLDGKIGYIRKACLTQRTDYDYDVCYVSSTNPYGYCYLYDQPSSVNGTNLGRHDNGEMIYVVNWYADDNYAYVKCQNGKTGYIRKTCLTWY